MLQKIGNFWKSLNKEIAVNQRELVLGVAACTLAGMVLGLLTSPRKTVTVGCNNGNNNMASFPEDLKDAGDLEDED